MRVVYKNQCRFGGLPHFPEVTIGVLTFHAEKYPCALDLFFQSRGRLDGLDDLQVMAYRSPVEFGCAYNGVGSRRFLRKKGYDTSDVLQNPCHAGIADLPYLFLK